MVSIADFGTAFVFGLLTPLGAACVLPLYPTFLVFLSKQLSGEASRKVMALLGLIVTLGVVLFMLIVGLVFTTVFQISLNSVIEVVSPIAFGILLIVGIGLVLNFDVSKYIPKAHTPQTKNPIVTAFLFGFGFGAIVIPCNPAFIAPLLARAAVASAGGFVSTLLIFLSFGLGIGFPLIVFSVISATKSSVIIGFFTTHQRKINLVIGTVMILVSLYYLFCVFAIFGNNAVTDAICMPLSALFSVVTG